MKYLTFCHTLPARFAKSRKWEQLINVNHVRFLFFSTPGSRTVELCIARSAWIRCTFDMRSRETPSTTWYIELLRVYSSEFESRFLPAALANSTQPTLQGAETLVCAAQFWCQRAPASHSTGSRQFLDQFLTGMSTVCFSLTECQFGQTF